MTPYVQKFLTHCMMLASLDKPYSWWAAKNYAELDPQLADLPKLLTTAMQQLQSSEPCATTTKSAEIQQRLRALKQQSGY